MPQTEQSFIATVTQVANLRYWLYLPQDYETQNAWPLIIFLPAMANGAMTSNW